MNNLDIMNNTRYALFAEYLFILLPFIVIAIVKIYTHSLETLLSAPDWSFAASILWGQTIVKLVSGCSLHGAIWQRLSLLVSTLIVLGIVPSLIILALMLISTTPSLILVSMQMILFVLSSIAFIWIGTAGQTLLESKE